MQRIAFIVVFTFVAGMICFLEGMDYGASQCKCRYYDQKK